MDAMGTIHSSGFGRLPFGRGRVDLKDGPPLRIRGSLVGFTSAMNITRLALSLRDLRSPWLLTTYKSWDDLPSTASL